MRREQLYLAEIVESADLVAGWLAGVGLDRWSEDQMLRDAVLHRLMIVGEAARSLGPAVKDRHPEVPWAGVVGLRNVVVHEYFAVEWPKVWAIVHEELPALRRAVAEIFEQEFPQAWARFQGEV